MRKAFTVIELIFVVVIIAIFAAAIFPKEGGIDEDNFKIEKAKAIAKYSTQPSPSTTKENW